MTHFLRIFRATKRHWILRDISVQEFRTRVDTSVWPSVAYYEVVDPGPVAQQITEDTPIAEWVNLGPCDCSLRTRLLRKLRAWWERLCDDTVRKLP